MSGVRPDSNPSTVRAAAFIQVTRPCASACSIAAGWSASSSSAAPGSADLRAWCRRHAASLASGRVRPVAKATVAAPGTLENGGLPTV